MLEDALLEEIDLGGEVFVRGKYFPDLDEGTHYLDINAYCSFAIKHGREHEYAMLGEGIYMF